MRQRAVSGCSVHSRCGEQKDYAGCRVTGEKRARAAGFGPIAFRFGSIALSGSLQGEASDKLHGARQRGTCARRSQPNIQLWTQIRNREARNARVLPRRARGSSLGVAASHHGEREREREREKSLLCHPSNNIREREVVYNKTYSLSHTSDGSRHIYLSSLALALPSWMELCNFRSPANGLDNYNKRAV